MKWRFQVEIATEISTVICLILYPLMKIRHQVKLINQLFYILFLFQGEVASNSMRLIY